MRLSVLMFFLIGMLSVSYSKTVPFHRGINLTNWFQTDGAHQIQFRKYSRQDFENIKSLDCDVIRLPINLHAMTYGAPDYKVDPLLFEFLDQVVDWCEDLGMHLILDNHSFDPAANTSPEIGQILNPVWQQMAQHFKERSELLYYEILNEPHGIADQTWNDIQQQVVAEIRKIDSLHTLIVGPASWNSYNNLQYMPEYADSNLIYTFHFYDPFVFTHQGASWTDPSLVSLADVPFPYMASHMPDCPDDLKGTWIEGALNNYSSQGTIGYVRSQIDKAVHFAQQRNVPVFCGELGVYIPNSPEFDRVLWYQIVTDYLTDNGISWTLWDYQGGFGLFEKGSNELFNYDLNVDLLKAVGFNVPPQKEFILKPDSTTFTLYDDYFGININANNWTNEGFLDYYSDSTPHSGKYCLYWAGSKQYSYLAFDFKPNKDLHYLVEQGALLDFWVKGNQNIKFDVRFVDTKTGADDHPWRKKKTIDHSLVDFNGQWQHVQIPLSDFVEGGSWDNGWFEPKGLFDWAAVDKFEIVAEYQDFTGQELWFDDIYVVNPATGLLENDLQAPKFFELQRVFPNPFNNQIVFEVAISRPLRLKVEIFDLKGRKVKVLFKGMATKKNFRLIWDGRDQKRNQLSSGLYLVRFTGKNAWQTMKILLIK